MQRKLYRDAEGGLLAGVALGLAGCFKLPVFLFRLLFIVLLMALGLGLFLYIALWLLLPEKGKKGRIIDRVIEKITKWKSD